MFFAEEPETCGRWWAEHLAGGIELQVVGDFCCFDVGGVEIGFHPADTDRNPRGGSPVVYWTAMDVHAQRQAFLDAGCTPHRGPNDVEPGRRICQLVDPFGNVFGLDGP
jgi:predicted enzyme related to lactoylglutathione lyase